MSRLATIQPAEATGKAKELLNAVKAKMGMVPNLTKVMANSPAVLEGYLGLAGALAAGTLEGPIQEQLAIATAQTNGCDYCLSAHTALAKRAGLTPQQAEESRDGKGNTPRATAALTFAAKVVASKGEVTDQVIEEARAAGFNDGQLAEIVGHVALNIFTNYFNNVAHTAIDFPKVVAARAR